jgi:hypothetical protein
MRFSRIIRLKKIDLGGVHNMSVSGGPKIYGIEKMVMCLDGGNPKSARGKDSWYDLSISGSYFTASSVTSMGYSSSFSSSVDGYYAPTASYFTDQYNYRSYVGTSSFSFGLWFNPIKLDLYGDPPAGRLVQKAGSPNSYWGFDLYSTFLQLEIRDNSVTPVDILVNLSYNFSTGNTYYILVSVDRPALQIRSYINGQLFGTTAIPGNFNQIDSTLGFTFPSSFNPTWARFFRGEMYMRSFSDEEAWQNFCSFRGRYGL